jgi:hypothetical protein
MIKQWLSRILPTGTRSILWGVHAFWIHPWFVAAAWTKLYGFPADFRLWIAFFVHDLGYLGKDAMDSAEGETHPKLGAWIMLELCGQEWHDLCLYHSRFFSKRAGVAPSRLCMADKFVPSLEPWWFYLPRAWASGELWEYLRMAGGRDGGKHKGEPNSAEVQRLLDLYFETGRWRYWYQGMALFSKEYAYAHRDGGQDTWTPTPKEAR